MQKAAGFILDSLENAYDCLCEHESLINDLNVFPIPDGDTGTNMVQTVKRTVRGAKELKNELNNHHIAELAVSAAQGNSGVILSQFIQGVCGALEPHMNPTPKELSKALSAGAESAYTAVLEPKEGTMLTVMRKCAAAAQDESADDYCRHILEEGFSTLKETREILPQLREAGVVDSGGLGFLCVLYGFFCRANKGPVWFPSEEELRELAGTRITGQSTAQPGFHKYCFEFVLDSPVTSDVQKIRSDLGAFGDSVIVAQGGEAFHIHIHTDEPDAVLSYANRLGTAQSVKYDDTHQQISDFLDAYSAGETSGMRKGVGAISVANSVAFAKIMTQLGAARVIIAPTMSPSVGQLVDAIEAVPFPSVVLLPNSANGQMAAQSAAKRASKPVKVLPSRTIVQGISVLVSLLPDQQEQDWEQILEEMQSVHTITIAQAVRDTVLYGTHIEEETYFAFDEKRVVATGRDRLTIAKQAMQAMTSSEAELISIYYGWSVTEDEAMQLMEYIKQLWPSAEVQVYASGQSHVDYIIGLQ